MVLERIFGSSSDSDLDFNSPKDKYGLPEEQDCFACKAMGTTAMVSLGIYTYHTGSRNLLAQRAKIEASRSPYKYGSRKLGIISIAASLVGAGMWRAFN